MSMDKHHYPSEGERSSEHRRERQPKDLISEGKLEHAAHKARELAAAYPGEARRRHRATTRLKRWFSIRGMVARGRSLFERIRLAVRERLGH